MEDNMENRKKGTTVVALKYNDVCAIAAERLVSQGFSRAGYIKKLRKINDSVVFGGAGGVGDIQYLGSLLYARNKLYELERNKSMTANRVAQVLSNHSRGAYGDFIIAGKDMYGVGIYSIDAAGAKLSYMDNIMATGSGSENAIGVLEAGYKELTKKEGVTKDDIARLAARAVYAATKRNLGSGGSIDLYLIDFNEGMKEYGDDEVKRLLEGLE